MPPQQPKNNSSFNVNTLLLTIILALSGWTLREVIDLGKTTASATERIRNLERAVYREK